MQGFGYEDKEKRNRGDAYVIPTPVFRRIL